MIEQGRILTVDEEDAKGELAADAAIGVTVLTLDDAYPFNETGGQLELNGAVLNYTKADPDASTVTLASTLAVAAVAGDTAFVYPYGTVKIALVDLYDSDDAQRAIVPFSYTAALDVGIRDESEQEQVTISDEKGRWEIAGLDEEIPSIGGSYVSGAGLPPAVPSNPPATSPTLKVTGTTTSLVVEASDVEAGTLIDYYISTTDGFSPGSSSLYATTQSTVLVIPNLPAAQGGGPILADTDYFLVAMAHNVLGNAPAYSPQVTGRLNLDNVDELVAARLIAGFILAGTIQVGQMLIDANTGITINRPGGGYVLKFPVDGITPLEMTAQIVAQMLNVENNLSINGAAQINGDVAMANGIVSPPKQPGEGPYYPSITTIMGDGTADVSGLYHGMIEHPTNNTLFVIAVSFFGAAIRFIKKSDGTSGAFPDPTDGKAWCTDFYPQGGIVYLSGSYYVLGFDTTRFSEWYIYKIDGTTFNKTAEVWVAGSFASAPRLWTDGTNILNCWVTSAKNLYVKGWDTALNNTPTVTSTMINATPLDARYNIGDVVYGNIDGIGSNRFWVCYRNSDKPVYCYNPSSWSRDSTRDFSIANGATVNGMCYDSTNTQMLHYDSTGILYRYGKYPVNKSIQGKYAWYDADGTGGTHETIPGPPKTYTLPARAYLNVSVDTPPDINNTDPSNNDKANQVALYLSDDGGTTWHRTVFSGGVWTGAFPTLSGIGTALPKTTNEFLTAGVTPGKIHSLASDVIGDLISLAGDGSFRFGVYKSTRIFGSRTMTSSTTISTGTVTRLSWGSNKEAPVGVTWDSTNQAWSIIQPGIYRFDVSVCWDNASTAGRRIAYIYKNGTAYVLDEVSGNISSNAATATQDISVEIPCVAGDLIDNRVLQNTGGNLSVNPTAGGDSARHFFSCGIASS